MFNDFAMAMSEFDIVIDRRESGSLKWHKYRGTDVISMWVADMDFQSPPAVRQAMQRRIEHGIFGYSVPTERLNETVVNRTKKLFGWEIEAEWIVWLPSLVVALDIASRLVAEDEEIITFVPAYPPFLEAPMYAQRRLKTVGLIFENNKWTIDLAGFRRAVTAKTRLLILCNPHNPVGRVFNRDELEAVAEVCLKNNILICSDEIHCELILSNKKHITLSLLSDQVQDKTITLMSPSKTFNVAGLNCGYAVIPNASLRKRFVHISRGVCPPCVDAIGLEACQAAFTDCEEWKGRLLSYLKENKNIVLDYVNNQMQPLSMADVEATYLAWIDARRLNVSDSAAFFERGGVRLHDGKDFGTAGFVRLNFGCPRQVLLEALVRMKKAVNEHLAAKR